MHAFLFVGKTRKARWEAIENKLTEWNIKPFDRVIVENDLPSLGISTVRELEHRLKLKPYQSKYTVAVIKNAHKLTVQGQQALLKTLEEPPPLSRIILETANSDILLPTILSRCHIIDLGITESFSKNDMTACLNIIKKLQSAPLGQRFAMLDEIVSTKEDAVRWVDLAIAAGREALLVEKFSPKLLRKLLTARRQLSVNVNPKLVLDNLFLP